MQILKFKTVDEVIERANNSEKIFRLFNVIISVNVNNYFIFLFNIDQL